MIQGYDPKGKCPKCGGEDTRAAYEQYCRSRASYWLAHPDLGEHLGRTCRYCWYEWPEAVKEVT